MNPKYYPRLRRGAELAAEILPVLRVQVAAARDAAALFVPVHHALMDIGVDDKDQAHEVAVMLYTGLYIEVNNHYRGRVGQ